MDKQLKPLIENYLDSYREVEFIETSLVAYPWYEKRKMLSSMEKPHTYMVPYECWREMKCLNWFTIPP